MSELEDLIKQYDRLVKEVNRTRKDFTETPEMKVLRTKINLLRDQAKSRSGRGSLESEG